MAARLYIAPLLIPLLAALAPASAFAAPAAGKIILEQRLRYEGVDQDGPPKQAQALTLRTRLGYQTPAWHGLTALVEGENVLALSDRYNSTINGKIRYPTVADPEATELNRLQVNWTGEHGGVTVGRQRIVLGAARFIGNVGFRQNEQTFDAVRVDAKPMKGVTATYAYVDKVHRVFGPESPQGEWNSDSHLMQVDAATPAGQLSAYGILLDFSNAPAQSNATWGVRLAGARPLGDGKSLTYEGEYARQSDYGGNPARFSLDYVDAAVGLKSQKSSVALGYERLEGDGRQGFQTPLATLHAYQGWADVFLTTPRNGVRDLNLRAATSVKLANGKAIRLQIAAHDFQAMKGGQDYGSEVDVLASYPLTKRLSLEAKAARFDGSAPGFADRTKVWASLEFKL
jgi:hypothetical protein